MIYGWYIWMVLYMDGIYGWYIWMVYLFYICSIWYFDPQVAQSAMRFPAREFVQSMLNRGIHRHVEKYGFLGHGERRTHVMGADKSPSFCSTLLGYYDGYHICMYNYLYLNVYIWLYIYIYMNIWLCNRIYIYITEITLIWCLHTLASTCK